MISIVIPLYNKAASISATLGCVLRQTYNDWEVVVVDDGSTDGSGDLVSSINDTRFRLIRQQNAGVSAARNRGVAEAKGEFVAFLDADDEWDPHYLESQMKLADKYPKCQVFATNYSFQTNSGKRQKTILNKIAFQGESGILDNYFEVASSGHPPLWTSAVMVRKSALVAVGGFPLGVRSGEDLLTWARLACYGSIAYTRIAMAVFKIEGYDVKERPKRLPAKDDVVGRELAILDQTYHSLGLKMYRAHWHKMRSSIYMRLRMRRKSIQEAVKGLQLNPRNYKLYAFIVLNLLPSKLQPF